MQTQTSSSSNNGSNVARLLVVKPCNISGPCRTGTLRQITVAQINAVLGFAPNLTDDPYKVAHSWGFTVAGVAGHFGIWDYKGSQHIGQFSTYGNPATLQALFGANYSQP